MAQCPHSFFCFHYSNHFHGTHKDRQVEFNSITRKIQKKCGLTLHSFDENYWKSFLKQKGAPPHMY